MITGDLGSHWKAERQACGVIQTKTTTVIILSQLVATSEALLKPL